MNHHQQKIFEFTQKLQQQTELPLWAIADESVIFSISQNKRPQFGNTSRKIRYLILIARKFRFTDYLIFIIGFFRVFSIWRRLDASQSIHKKYERIFAGFGAASEQHLYTEYQKKYPEPLLYINWVNYIGMNASDCPSLLKIFSTLRKNALGLDEKFKIAIPEIQNYAIDFLTVCARNIGIYAFFCVYWERAQHHGVREILFLAPDIPAHAAADLKINTVFVQHGLLSLSILIPKFQRIHAITEIEARYFKKLFPNISIIKINYAIFVSKNKNNTILILSADTLDRIKTIEPFVNWAKNFGMTVVIRPSNKITQLEISLLQNTFPDCVIDDVAIPIYKSLENWQPKFVAAWTSTILANALEYGYAAISFFHPAAEMWNCSVYPLQKSVLFWPMDKHLIEKIAQSTEVYKKYLLQFNKTQNFTCEKPEIVISA